jgi:hypothetical protein
METVSDESCRETKKHKIYVQQLVSENRVVYEITWKNMVQPYRPQMTIWYGACALRATDTHSEYVTLIAFPRQQQLCERALMSRGLSCVQIILQEGIRKGKQIILFSTNILVGARIPLSVQWLVACCKVLSSNFGGGKREWGIYDTVS